MALKNSVFLLFFIASWVFAGGFIKTSLGQETFENQCEIFKGQPHPFLCDEKMPLSQATPFDLALVDGISLALARKITLFIQENPQAKIEDVNEVKGVGDKTLSKLKTYFL